MPERKTTKRQSERKFGKQVIERGFTIVPSVLLQCQERLGISGQQLAILIHLMDFWWEPESKPWPSKEKLAKRMQVSTKTIQRQMKALETAGYLQRVERFNPNKGQTSNEYDLSGLVSKLQTYADELQSASEEAEAITSGARRPKHRRRSRRKGVPA